MDSVRTWAERDGIVQAAPSPAASAAHAPARTSLLAKIASVVIGSSGRVGSAPAGGTSEGKDPDLTFAMQRVLAVGAQLDALRDCNFCGKTVIADDDDVDGAEDEADDGEDDGDDGDDEEDDEKTKVNGTAVASLLEFEGEMKGSVDKFESGVHPHGKKWWRYRYEYTLVESLVLACSVMFLYVVMWILAGVSFFDKFKFYNIGLTHRLYRYAWGYFLFHSAALMVMVTLAYMLYMPWGEHNIFDYCAKHFHAMVDGRANVPFLGYSWLLMVLDVQFQLFVTFTLYAFFILCVTRSFARAMDDWRALGDNDIATRSARLPINDYHFKDFHDIMTHRVSKSPTFARLFETLRLRYRAVDGIDSHRQQGYNDFKLHLYFTTPFAKRSSIWSKSH